MRHERKEILFLLICSVLMLSAPSPVPAQQPPDFFRQNCMSCHTIGGGRITGPDLKDVVKRKDRGWLERFLRNPKAMMDAGDPYALQLQQEARGVVMPAIQGMTPDMARALLDLIDAESKLPKSQFAGAMISDRPLTPADLRIGGQLFSGTRPLANHGPACISCHTLGTLTGLGGGRLGPDLTRVYERLGGRKSVGAWLVAPATPTMQAVFRRAALQPDEILPLLAAMEDAGNHGREADERALLKFFLVGFSGMVLGLVILGKIWGGRFRAVRRPLVRGER